MTQAPDFSSALSTLCKVGATHEAPALYGLEDAGGNVAEFDFKTHDILATLHRLSSTAQGGGASRLHNALKVRGTMEAAMKQDLPETIRFPCNPRLSFL